MQATLVQPTLNGRAASRRDGTVSAVAARIPDDGGNGVREILHLLEGLPATTTHHSPLTTHQSDELDRERRRLQHALTMLQSARQRLHQQFVEAGEHKQRVLHELRREWHARQRALESQLAAAALQKARDELDEERAHLEAEFHQRLLDWEQQRQRIEQNALADVAAQHAVLEQHRRLLQVERERLAEIQQQTAALQQRGGEFEQQLVEARQQRVQAELALVEQRTRHAAQRRQWTDERSRAEVVIRDLLAELHAVAQSAVRAEPPARNAA